MFPDILVNIGAIALGLVGLLIGGNGLVQSASRLAASFGVSALVIGLTVVAIGTSTPELVVSVSAALQGSSDIALGNVVGSNIANIGLILGLAGVIAPLAINNLILRRDMPVMIGISLLTLILSLDGSVGLLDGLLLVAGYVVFAYMLYRSSTRDDADPIVTAEVSKLDVDRKPQSRLFNVLWLLVSLAILIVGAQFTVSGAVSIARALGVSELVIGLTLVAVGTSLPEIVTSLIATIRGENDLAVGNVVGSNIANILVILGVTAIISPVGVAAEVLQRDIPVMIGFAVLLLLLVLDRRLGRIRAAVILAAYIAFVILSFSTSTVPTP